MAASAVRGLLMGCRRITFRSAGSLPRAILSVFCRRSPELHPVQHSAAFHLSAARRGLEEFFDDPKNWGEKTVKSGDSWTVNQLREKSSEDLHKLWYVLLKENNMLLSLEQESKRQRLAMPSPERLYKVTKSMENLDLVVTERETALRLLQTGQEKARPGEWRKDCFGETTWHRFKEWPIPWYLNKRHMQKKFYALPYVDHYDRLRLEKKLRTEAKLRNAAKHKQRKLERKFPPIASKS
ncbi:large ribosomal subunit protein uL29m [Gastrophryne carolinensis]